MSRPLLIDLYCGLGGAGMGYFLAGFDVLGVDSMPQPDYPFEFIQADIRKMRIVWKRASAIHASPPCKRFTRMSAWAGGTQLQQSHPNLIPGTRRLLERSGLPYVIENVPDARDHLINPVELCGSMFNLHTANFELIRHRLFELGRWGMPMVPKHKCRRKLAVSVVGDHARITGIKPNGKRGTIDVGAKVGRQLMGITWSRNAKGISQAIPPPYTQFLGYHLRHQL